MVNLLVPLAIGYVLGNDKARNQTDKVIKTMFNSVFKKGVDNNVTVEKSATQGGSVASTENVPTLS